MLEALLLLVLSPGLAAGHPSDAGPLMEQGKWKEAAALLERYPHNPQALNDLGSCRLMLGNPLQAEKAYNRSLAVMPEFPVALSNRCLTRVVLGRAKQGLADCESALETPAGQAWEKPWANRGFALFELGRFKEASTSFSKAAKLEPQVHDSWLGLAAVAFSQGRREEARTLWLKAAKIDPSVAQGREAFEKENGSSLGPKLLPVFLEMTLLFGKPKNSP